MPVTGAGQLERLGLRLKFEGAIVLRRELLFGIREGAKPLIGDVRDAALKRLSKRGGLNAYVAESDIKVVTRLTGARVGVRIVNTRKNAKRGGTSDFGSDRGVVRHPVFGHRDRKWAETKVEPGWFTETLNHAAPTVTPFISAALIRTAAQLNAGVVR